jgi:3-dehydroquinate dehydratase-1
MKKNNICAVITGDDQAGIETAGKTADFFEVRIDLIGKAWPEVARRLNKPWIATNRGASQHGKWRGSEGKRTDELLKAMEMGAWMVDIELESPGLAGILRQARGKTKCMVSHHDWKGTPSTARLAKIVNAELSTGAYACKVVTTAGGFQDNIKVMKLFGMFPAVKLIAFAMGAEGVVSRVMAPLAGAYFTYASINDASASAPGQVTVKAMNEIYRFLK